MTGPLERPAAPDIASRLLPYIAPPVVLLAILAPFFRFYHYDPLLPESLILIGGAALLGAAIGALAQTRRVLATALMTLTLCIYLFCRKDVIAFLVGAINAIGPVTGHPFAVLATLTIAMIGVTFLVCVMFRRHLDLIVATVFGTMIVSTLALPVAPGGAASTAGELPKSLSDLPPVVHIILDEHIGLAGLPEDLAEADEATRIILATYQDFAVYTHAFSRFGETKFSLTSLMNGDRGPDVAGLLAGDRDSFSLKENAWFDVLKRKGYAVAVYQSSWFDLCRTASVDVCFTYPMFSPNPIQRAPLTTAERLTALAQLFMSPFALQTEPLVSLEALARFRSDLAKTPRGVAYVVHLLMPHHGYLYASDCTLREPSKWSRYESDGGYSAEEREILYRLYLQQVACTEKQMSGLFAEMRALGVYDDATIIVHGDHGSRLGEGPLLTGDPDALSTRDRLDHFSTLLAVK